MNKSIYCLLLVSFVVAAVAAPAFGATVLLRKKSNHHGSMVYLADIADITTESLSERDNLKSVAIMPSPAPGTHQYLSLAQLRSMLEAQGIDLGRVQLGGATTVEFGTSQPLGDRKKPQNSSNRNREQIESSFEASLIKYLRRQTGHDHWRVEFAFDTASYLRMASLQGDLKISGGRKPWHGRQAFSISTDNNQEPVRVFVSAFQIQEVVAAVGDIAAGDLIRASDLELKEVEGKVARTAVGAAGDIIGMQARRSISAGKVLQENDVVMPLQVERGETVTVFARTAGIAVRTFAIARQNGAMGELIQVETLDKKDRFVARVSGLRELEVLAAGATVSDYASLPRHTTYRR